MAQPKIALGAKVKDKITGYKGVVTGRAEYLTGCIQYLVTQTKTNKEGAIPDGEWLDEVRLIETEGLGGPQRNAPPTK